MTAVVTGGGGDIGRTTALLLAAEGAQVLVVDIDPEALRTSVDAIVATGGRAKGMVADVSVPADVEAYAREAQRLGGGSIDLFFNNAGIEGNIVPLVDLDVEDFDRVLSVNARGVFLGLKHVLPRMADGGAVVNTSSVGGLRGSVGLSAYVASKHAVIGLTKTAALEMASRGIRVSAVCPGPVEGRMISAINAQRVVLPGAQPQPAAAPAATGHSLARYAEVEEVARAVAFLLGPEATYVSGTALVVDGGMTAR
jgi:NAD(P)-dependent dehydrogenase (short-subunit alcohol dehydrogenase family)